MCEINLIEISIPSIIFILCSYFLFRYLKNYFEAKGKNYADKKDIRNITEIVEGIKNQNAQTLALVNANLNLASKGIESFEAEVFKSYVAFHQATVYVFRDLTMVDFTLFNVKNLPYLTEYSTLTTAAYKTLSIAKANLDLFNDQEEILEVAFELHKASILRLNEINQMVIKIRFSIQNIDEYEKKLMDLSLSSTYDEILIKHYKTSLKDTETELKEQIEELRKLMIGESMKEGFKLQSRYEKLIRKYIKDEKLKILVPQVG